MGQKYKLLLEHAKSNKGHYQNVIALIDEDRDSLDELLEAGYTEKEAFKTFYLLNGELLSKLTNINNI
ncbi:MULTISPECIES: hypothetical protein [Listeria]|uniref:Uncharacterized protein n=1 Tax=Listeria cornellensis FSL F6-0969 TaxID=1265820 RepID=W7C210_9LIST|nr:MULTISPECIES: hypothetical protein [Listeria]EUJ29646.1 hypothetical protein PCORN_10887 [Listeria cornellensis FSL F6-0969]KGL44085.1 hypothetical protein EP58_06440 [Listeria newyorkensis]SQC57435.1 Uncharacterised protein [Listeria newyorkensis]